MHFVNRGIKNKVLLYKIGLDIAPVYFFTEVLYIVYLPTSTL